MHSPGNGTATASSLLTFYFWTQAERTSHVAVFYKASGQTSPQTQREKVYFGLRAARCCRAEQARAVQQQLRLLAVRALALPGRRGAGTPLPAQQTCCGAPRLQDLLREKETSPAARTKDNSAPRIQSLHPEPCPGSARPLASRPQRAAQAFGARREHAHVPGTHLTTRTNTGTSWRRWAAAVCGCLLTHTTP